MHAVLQDTESEWGTPRSTMTLPDFSVLSGSVSPIPELEALEALSTDAAPIRTHLPEGRRRVFIPDMPVTPVAERRCVHTRSPSSHQPLLQADLHHAAADVSSNGQNITLHCSEDAGAYVEMHAWPVSSEKN